MRQKSGPISGAEMTRQYSHDYFQDTISHVQKGKLKLKQSVVFLKDQVSLCLILFLVFCSQK